MIRQRENNGAIYKIEILTAGDHYLVRVTRPGVWFSEAIRETISECVRWSQKVIKQDQKNTAPQQAS